MGVAAWWAGGRLWVVLVWCGAIGLQAVGQAGLGHYTGWEAAVARSGMALQEYYLQRRYMT